MAYTKLNNIPLDGGESIAAQIEHGKIVAVAVIPERDEHTNRTVYVGWARVIDTDGVSVLDAHGQPIISRVRHSVPPEVVRVTGFRPNSRLKEVALGLLGEPATLVAGEPLISWPAQMRADISIRNAIACANSTGVVPLHNLL